MTGHGVVVLTLIGLVLIVWISDLVRRDRLYVGYGVLLIVSIVGVLPVLLVPRLLALVTRLVGAVFPASALTLLALTFIVVGLIYVLTQLTIVSNRVATLIQELAVQQAKKATGLGARQPAAGTSVVGRKGPGDK
jgi:hypothetical protein